MAAYPLLHIFVQIFCISIIIGTTCIRKFTNRPFNGYHCNTEYYANVTTIPRHRCTELCIKDPQCWILSYNSFTHCCLMGSELCITAESRLHSSMMVFRQKEVESCISWMSPLYNPAVPRRLVETRPHQSRPGAVGRMVVGENIISDMWTNQTRRDIFPLMPMKIVKPRITIYCQWSLIAVLLGCPTQLETRCQLLLWSSVMWLARVPITASELTDWI